MPGFYLAYCKIASFLLGRRTEKFRDRSWGKAGKERQIGCEDALPLSQWLS